MHGLIEKNIFFVKNIALKVGHQIAILWLLIVLYKVGFASMFYSKNNCILIFLLGTMT